MPSMLRIDNKFEMERVVNNSSIPPYKKTGVRMEEVEGKIAAPSSMFPGFRFSPTDEELILYYLHNKIHGFDNSVQVIPLVDICKFEPWDLPAKAIIKSDQEWFFFSPRGKKYPNGSQSKRATEIGYWKATGKERAVKSGSNVIGTKRTLVFHIGRAPKGERTEWTMHEYCMIGNTQDGLVVCRLRKKCDSHMNDGSSSGHNNNLEPNSSAMSNSVTNSGCGLDPLNNNERNKTIQSSHASHSVEQFDSASEANWKTKDEMLQHQSFTNHTKYENFSYEDDLYAEILNDNIVQLDECPPTSSMVSTTTTVAIIPRVYRQPGHPSLARSYPTFQGTSNRRIRLRKMRRLSPHKEETEEQSDENMIASPTLERSLRRSMLGGPMRLRIRGGYNRLYVVLITIAMVIMFLSYGTNPAGLVPYTKTPPWHVVSTSTV
ncbi:NAC domain-containing protein 60-like isoform X1 [Silene latifolia]|uniref:NAC domain-containing protein 60-like isoform X1 n=1 Tax=Silene latifolia TaxID=37657 RepID=UPI003D784C10